MGIHNKYIVGEKVNGVIYMGDCGYVYHKDGKKYRESIFICPFCSKEFKAILYSVKSGNTSSCGCKRV